MSHRFLLVQLADIGDLILTTPAIASLRESHPDAHLTLLTSSHSAVILPDDLVDEVITFDKQTTVSSWSLFLPANFNRIMQLRQGQYDTVIFFHHFTLKLGVLKFRLIAFASGAKRRVGLDNGNAGFLTHRVQDEGFGGKHQAQYWLDLVGLVDADTSPRPLQVQAESDVSDLIDTESVSPRVVLHAGSGGYSSARRWSTEKFAQVADELHTLYGADIILVGTDEDDGASVNEQMQYTPTDLTGKTNLNQLAGVIQQADIFIGADSGVMHLAGATGTPVVSIFGPSNYRAWHPWTPNSRSAVVTSRAECSPCSYVGDGIGLREGCEARTCMKMIATTQVLRATQRLLVNEPRIPRQSNAVSAQALTSQRDIVTILDVPVDRITYPQWIEKIRYWIESDEHAHHVCTTNPEFVMVAQSDSNFMNILQRADLCIPDGVGLLWAAKRLGKPIPERVTGSDGVPMIAEHAAQHGWKLFFLGAQEGVAQHAANLLMERHPTLEVVGTYSGSPSGEEEADIIEQINQSEADILFVAYGAPQQDKWIARNLPRLNIKMAMGVGGSFDFIAGTVPRAPKWMRRVGLEWLFRLMRQPWRLRRMMRLPRFVFGVLRHGAGKSQAT